MALISFFVPFFIFIVIGVSIPVGIGLATIIGMVLTNHTEALFVIVQQLSEGVQNYTLLAVPFFILSGNLMNETGMTDHIFDFANKLVGHVKGGLAQVNVVASMIFAGVSGAAVADAAGLGVIEIRAMEKRGYRKDYSAAITLASAIIGPLIPPSVGLVVYAVVAQQSVGRVLLSGIIPGILTGVSLMAMNLFYARKVGFFPPPEAKSSFKELMYDFKSAFFALMCPIVILYSLLGGFATATEAGIIAFLYAVLIALIYQGPKKLIKILPKVFSNSVQMSAMLLLMLAAAKGMGWFMARERIPEMLTNNILNLTDMREVFIALVIILYLITGTIIDGNAAKIIMVPILLPIAEEFGINPIWFGMITSYSLLLGLITPPVGVGLFVMTRVANITFENMVKSIIPFYIPLAIVLLILCYFPGIWIWVPNLIMGPL